MTQKEKIIENDILKWLNYQLGAFAIKVNTTGFFDPKRKVFRKNHSAFLIPGTPDIFCVYTVIEIPVAVFLEVKSSTGRQSESQKHFEILVKHHGGFYFIVRSIDEVETALSQVRDRVKSILKAI